MGSLLTISVVSLHQHNLLSDQATLLNRTEANNATSARIRLLVTMRDTHTSTNRHIESGKFSIRICDSYEANIVRIYIDVVDWRDRNCNFELYIPT